MGKARDLGTYVPSGREDASPLTTLMLDPDVGDEKASRVVPLMIRGRRGAGKNTAEMCDPNPASGVDLPLVAAISAGRGKKVIDALLRFGASPNGTWDELDNAAPHPIHVALKKGDLVTLSTLLRHPRARLSSSVLSSSMVACCSGPPAAIIPAARMLLSKGADKSAVYHGRSPLHVLCSASFPGRLEAVHFFLEEVRSDPNVRSPGGPTALAMLMSGSGYDPEVERLMRDKGARVIRSKRSHVLLAMSATVSLVTFVQLTSVPFVVGNPWPGEYRAVEDVLQFTMLDLERIGVLGFAPLFWTVYGLVGAWILLSLFYRSRGPCRALLPLMLPLAWVLAVVAFLPVIHVLLGVFDCTRNDATGKYTLDRTEGEEECYHTDHVTQMVITGLAIPLYMLLTARLQRVDGLWFRLELSSDTLVGRLFRSWDLDDLQSSPKNVHVFKKNTTQVTKVSLAVTGLKVLMIAGAVFLTNNLSALAAVNLLVAFLFWVFSLVLPSYINRQVNAAHTAGFSGVVWSNIAAVLAVNGRAPRLTVFLAGYAGSLVFGHLLHLLVARLLAGSGAYRAAIDRLNRESQRRHERRADAVKRARAKERGVEIGDAAGGGAGAAGRYSVATTRVAMAAAAASKTGGGRGKGKGRSAEQRKSYKDLVAAVDSVSSLGSEEKRGAGGKDRRGQHGGQRGGHHGQRGGGRSQHQHDNNHNQGHRGGRDAGRSRGRGNGRGYSGGHSRPPLAGGGRDRIAHNGRHGRRDGGHRRHDAPPPLSRPSLGASTEASDLSDEDSYHRSEVSRGSVRIDVNDNDTYY